MNRTLTIIGMIVIVLAVIVLVILRAPYMLWQAHRFVHATHPKTPSGTSGGVRDDSAGEATR